VQYGDITIHAMPRMTMCPPSDTLGRPDRGFFTEIRSAL